MTDQQSNNQNKTTPAPVEAKKPAEEAKVEEKKS